MKNPQEGYFLEKKGENLTDIFSKEKRSWVMSRIRSKDTKIEKLMEQKLNEHEIRFKKHYKIFGTPDFVIEDKKIAIFLDGEFWHGHKKGKVKLRKLPEYWQKKIAYNKKRMQTVNQKLKKEGWIVLRFWERDLNKNLDSCIKILLQKLRE